MRKKILSALLSVTMLASLCGAFAMPASAATAKEPQYEAESRKRPMEKLNRGLVAAYRTADNRSVMSADAGVYLSWRLLGKESLTNQAFDIYRSTSETGTFTKIGTSESDGPTNYIDKSGNLNYWYKVVPAGADSTAVVAEAPVKPTTNYTAKGSEVGNGNSHPNSFTYIDIPIERPDPVERMGDGKKSYYYTYDKDHEGGANDASVGDIDGDGEYEIILKWDPTDSKDSAGYDYTGNCYIDAYEIDPNNTGYKWRIDLGKNVTSGAHYTQFIVYDFDNDGKAEIAMKTAPGTVDGTGHYVTEVGDTEAIRSIDNTKSYIGTSGRMKGKNPYTQFVTVFDGETGAALATTEYIPYDTFSTWGDSNYNRSERYLAGVAYLDGVTPSIIMCRGYYNQSALRAYNWDGQTLSMVWEHKGASKSATSMYGNGNHQLSISDIDDDGKDEIVYGSVALDDDGKNAMGNTYLGHGDALHVSDFNNDGVQEAFSVQEDNSDSNHDNGENLRVVSTGKIIYGIPVLKDAWNSKKNAYEWPDVGRGVMANIDDEYAKEHPEALSLGWDSYHSSIYGLDGTEIGVKPAGAGSGSFDNSLVYWDGDLSRELLDANIIQKYDAENGWTKRFYGPSDGYTLTGGTTNNYTKRNASLSADLWGDWREEIILPVNKNSPTEQAYLRIFTSTIWTDYRLTTLMHDSQYRTAIAWQNVGYNQPPHQSYYIGSASLATDADGNTKKYLAPAVKFTNIMYPEDIPVIPVTSLSIDKTTLTIEKTKSEKITATVLPADATKKNVTWRSSDEKVASVSNGTVTGIGKGTATITAIAAGGEIKQECTVTVTSVDVENITLNKEQMNISASQTEQLTATITPNNASEKGITWRSSNPAVATVSDTGLVTTVSTGLATVYATAKDNGKEAACVVNVVPAQDITGSHVFVTDNTDAETVLADGASATAGTLTQTGAAVGGNMYRTFDPIASGKTKLRFKFTTGGKQIVDKVWDWKDHEYSLYVKILGNDDSNILTFKQPFTKVSGDKVVAETLTTTAGTESEANFATGWNPVIDGFGQISGSAKRWIVDMELDYDNHKANVTLSGANGDWVVQSQYTKSFSIPDGISLGKLEISTTQEGTGTIITNPMIVQELSYSQLGNANGASTTLLRRGERMGISWSDTDVNGWTQTPASSGLMYDEENKRIWFNNTKPAASYEAKKAFDVTADSTITYDVDWYFASNTGANHYEYLKLGSNLCLGWNGADTYNVYVSADGGSTWGSTPIFTGENKVSYVKNVNVVVDTATNTIKSFKFGGSDVSSVTTLPDGTEYGEVSFGLSRQEGSATQNWAYPNGIDNIMVSEFVAGATPKFNVQFINDDGTVLKEETMEVGDTPSYTGTPTKNGDAKYGNYTFEGWDKEFAPVVDDTIYTAQYTGSNPKSYTVKLYPHDGTIADGEDVTEYTYSDNESVALPTPARTGYTFLGWFASEESTITEPVGTGVDDEIIEEESFREIHAGTTGDVVLHARWSPEVYDVTLSANGGNITSGNITSYSYGDAVTLPTEVKKTGSTFLGWYDNEDFEGEPVTKIEAGEMGSKTFYAKFEEVVYTVTLNTNGGTLETPLTGYTYGAAVTLPKPTKTGMTFGGWYETDTFMGRAVTSISATASGNKTYYAKWTSSASVVEIDSIKQDGKTAIVNYAVTEKGTVVAALYNNDGTLKQIKTVAVDDEISNFALKTQYTKELAFDYNIADYKLKVFIWNSLNGMKAIAQTPAQ